jgi:hypothetical protein
MYETLAHAKFIHLDCRQRQIEIVQ